MANNLQSSPKQAQLLSMTIQFLLEVEWLYHSQLRATVGSKKFRRNAGSVAVSRLPPLLSMAYAGTPHKISIPYRMGNLSASSRQCSVSHLANSNSHNNNYTLQHVTFNREVSLRCYLCNAVINPRRACARVTVVNPRRACARGLR